MFYYHRLHHFSRLFVIAFLVCTLHTNEKISKNRLRGLSKVEFAQALGKRPSEVTKWLSGQHNFTLRTI